MPNNAKISQILGIDFGTAKVGIAIADTEIRIAFVYATLKNDGNFLTDLTVIIEQERIETIVIGVPNYLHHEKSATAGEKLGEMIGKAFPRVRIEYQNEMFTTKSAHANLHEAGKKNVSKNDDAESARIILQEWLEKNFITIR